MVEPGVYLPSILGIRLENVYVVVVSTVPQYTLLHPTLIRQRKFLRLETLDYIPFQRKMILDELMTGQEWDMLRVYHEKCIEKGMGQWKTKRSRRYWLEWRSTRRIIFRIEGHERFISGGFKEAGNFQKLK